MHKYVKHKNSEVIGSNLCILIYRARLKTENNRIINYTTNISTLILLRNMQIS